eukprot:scaffold6.g2647.t1
MAAACMEHLLELRLCPWIKLPAVTRAGLVAVLAGEVLRKSAMITARHNFTHMLQFRRRPGHALVTRGVYARVRHPGYAGWLLWAVGTQGVLCNPVCSAAFAALAWLFFRYRIAAEDLALERFFGEEWRRYWAAVPSGIPGVP